MIERFVELLLSIAGVVAGKFVPPDQLAYTIIQFVIVLLMILAVSVLTIYVPIAISRWKARQSLRISDGR